ncbi:MAG TPA: hypothetical protein VIT45_11775 [Allosphingosinicella sp.]
MPPRATIQFGTAEIEPESNAKAAMPWARRVQTRTRASGWL